MRALMLIPLAALPVLAACSGENQGWNPNYRAEATPYGDYLRARENALMGRQAEPPRVIPLTRPFKAPTPAEIRGPSPVQMIEGGRTIPVPPGQVRRSVAPSVDANATGRYPISATAVAPVAVVAAPVVVAPVVAAPRRAAPATAAPVVVTATPLPPAGGADPLTAYALANRQAPGNRVYARSGGSGGSCASFPTPADAQRFFLAQGGPQRDPLGLDPDGDGFVCGWNPAPYRAAAAL